VTYKLKDEIKTAKFVEMQMSSSKLEELVKEWLEDKAEIIKIRRGLRSV